MSAVFAQADKCEAETIDKQCNALDSQSDREECRRYYHLLCENTLTEDELKEIEALEEADRKWAAEKKRKRDEEIAKKEAERLAKLEKEEERLAKKAEIARQIDEWATDFDFEGCKDLTEKQWETYGKIDCEPYIIGLPRYINDFELTTFAQVEFSELTTEAFGENNYVLPISFYLNVLIVGTGIDCPELVEKNGPDIFNKVGWSAAKVWRNNMGVGAYEIIQNKGLKKNMVAYNTEFLSLDFGCTSLANGNIEFFGDVVVDIVGEGTKEDKIDAVKLAQMKLVQSMQDASDNNLELDPN